MRYLLVVLTHGAHEHELSASVGAFLNHVHPLPAVGYLAIDGPRAPVVDQRVEAVRRACGPYPPRPWIIAERERSAGFCTATREAWNHAAYGEADVPDYDYVVWLEHDFVVTRTVDLSMLAAVLDRYPMLAQMALMRDAVNETERAAGGLFESRPGQYEFVPDWDEEHGNLPWLRHHAYLTTNANLMRRSFMRANPWPAEHESECEGRFGLELVAAGYHFGVWGAGEPWTTHIGTRDGFGY